MRVGRQWLGLLAVLACKGGSGDEGSFTSNDGTTTAATSTATSGEPTSVGTTSADVPTTGEPSTTGGTTGAPGLPCDLLDPMCPPDQICEGGFEDAYCVPDLCIGVTCEGTLECYKGECTCAFADCPDGEYCDYDVEPEVCKPNPCAALDCPIFSWCYPDVGECTTCPEPCGPDEVCDQPSETCVPVVATAVDACADAPLVVVPPYPDDVWISGDLGAATTDPAFGDCTLDGQVEQVVRIQLNEGATFHFSGETESLTVSSRLLGVGQTCDAITDCGTLGVESGSGISEEYEFNLTYFFDPGEYLLIVMGPPGSGPWWIRIGQS